MIPFLVFQLWLDKFRKVISMRIFFPGARLKENPGALSAAGVICFSKGCLLIQVKQSDPRAAEGMSISMDMPIAKAIIPTDPERQRVVFAVFFI